MNIWVMRMPKFQDVSFCETLCLVNALRLLCRPRKLHWSVCSTQRKMVGFTQKNTFSCHRHTSITSKIWLTLKCSIFLKKQHENSSWGWYFVNHHIELKKNHLRGARRKLSQISNAIRKLAIQKASEFFGALILHKPPRIFSTVLEYYQTRC